MYCIKGVENFEEIARVCAANLDHYGQVIDNGEWQGKQGTDFDRTLEIQDVGFEWAIPPGMRALQSMIEPNLPWAEDHFLERVSGTPHNPPPSHEWWPYAQKANKEHRLDGKFSHTYPERFWPKFANIEGETAEGRQVFVPHIGVRFMFGDLSTLIELLIERPYTRQAYLPIWFPEDLTASQYNERVPCTLGYHFMLRKGQLTCRYFMRSLDFFRYFRDDAYMAARLTQYICNEVNEEWGETDEHPYTEFRPGNLVMHISSLHIFANERPRLKAMIERMRNERINSGWY